MTIYAMLTLDLNGNISTEVRNKFYESLKLRNFVKRKLTTTWTVTFKPHITKVAAEKYIRESVTLAALSSGVSNYEAAVVFSESPIVSWSTPVTARSLLGG